MRLGPVYSRSNSSSAAGANRPFAAPSRPQTDPGARPVRPIRSDSRAKTSAPSPIRDLLALPARAENPATQGAARTNPSNRHSPLSPSSNSLKPALSASPSSQYLMQESLVLAPIARGYGRANKAAHRVLQQRRARVRR